MKKVRGIISVAALTLGAALSAPAFACSPSDGGFVYDVLSLDPAATNNVSCGKYEFGGVHSNDTSFSDRWKFYASEDLTVSVSVFDKELDLDESNSQYGVAKLFDTNLTFTVLDNEAGVFLGWADENETLSGLHLEAGKWYTLKVYGYASGLFGSVYNGSLQPVTEVPLGDTAPLLSSALGLLALRLRKRIAA